MAKEPANARRVEKVDRPGRMAPAKARPKIEAVAAALREVAGRIADLPQTSLRDALLLELNSISTAIADLAARIPAGRITRTQ